MFAQRPDLPISRPRAYRSATGLALLCLMTAPAMAAHNHRQDPLQPAGPTIQAAPGTIVRWGEPGTEKCGMGKRVWPANEGTCYYPIDLLLKPGTIKVTRWVSGHKETGGISVQPFEYPTQQVDIGDIPQAAPTKDEEKRAKREEAVTARVFARQEGPARFTLPLGAPAKPLPEARDFGVKRVFNDTPAGQPHMGADFTINLGTPIHAVADGTVALAADQFFAGNAVYLDHGDGLVTEYFHLSKIEVHEGQKVRKGETIGLVGSTGRSTGAHLFFGARWHDARIDPSLLLGEPAKIPDLAAPPANAVATQGEGAPAQPSIPH